MFLSKRGDLHGRPQSQKVISQSSCSINRRNRFWAITLWSGESSMKAFMLSGVHHTVMRKLLDWCEEAALVRWTQNSAEPPILTVAYNRLRGESRRSKVSAPESQNT